LILSFIKTQAQTDNKFICIEHIGEGDNPLTPIFISSKDRVQKYDTVFVKVSRRELKIIKSIVIDSKDKIQTDPARRHFGIYRITLKNGIDSTVYFFDTEDRSLSFLKNLRNQIKSAGIINEKLDIELYLNIYSLEGR
jgi:hypothetical protein